MFASDPYIAYFHHGALSVEYYDPRREFFFKVPLWLEHTPGMKSYGAIFMNYKLGCFSHQYFFPDSLELGVCSLGYLDLLNERRLCFQGA